MKKLCLTALVALCSTALVPAAFAADTPAPKHKTTKKAAPKKKAPAKKATVAAAPAQPDEGSELWSCKDNERLFLKGDMKRDQILTLFWSGRNYKLPRQQTTTGADRFYDAASGLDLESIIPRLSRTQTTLITSGIAILIMYLGVVATNAISSITAMTVVLNAVAGPWVVINAIGFLVARTGRYDPVALQRYGLGVNGGRYWFLHGWNLRAVVPLIVGSAVGFLTVQNDLYAAPLANIAGGLDVSLPLSIVVGGGLYLLALRIWPETGIDDGVSGEPE